jgi:hypothetical protein
MTFKKKQFLIIVCVLLGIIAGCQRNKGEQISPVKETNLARKLKVNATQEDLCRLVLKQDEFVDTTISKDTKSVIMTVLSDGSDIKKIIDVDSLIMGYTELEGPDGFYLSNNLDKMILTIGYFGRPGRGKLYGNVLVYDLKTRQRDSLFDDNIKYEKTGYGLYVNQTIYNPANDLLTISTNVFFRRFNVRLYSFIDLPVYGNSFVNVGNNKIIYNRVHFDTVQCGIYDVRNKTPKQIRKKDTLDLSMASVTGDGGTILIEKLIESDSVGKIGDSLFFYDSTLLLKNASFIRYTENIRYTIGLSGNWIYYVDSVAVRRIRTEELINLGIINYPDMISKSQVVYELPYIIRDTDVKTICQGMVVQLLPTKSETK